MQLSTKSRYALRILLSLTENYVSKRSLKGKDIAKAQEITEAYLEQIMITLKQQDMVETVRGCNGGYLLKRPPCDITLLEIVEAFEGKLTFVRCLSGRSQCDRIDICSSVNTWKKLSDVVRTELAVINLESIAAENRRNGRKNYC